MVLKVAGKRKFESGLRHATTGKKTLGQPISFFELGNDKITFI